MSEAQLMLDKVNIDNEWFLNNFKELQIRYGGEFIAVYNKEVVAHSKSVDKLISMLKKNNIDPASILMEFIVPLGVITII